jgi:CRISPR-associated protein (TIGR03986 family)
MATGTVKKIMFPKGDGFIKMDAGGKDIHFNIKDKGNRYVPQPGERVSFDIKKGNKGIQATNLTPKSYNWQFINPYNFIRTGDAVKKDPLISHHQFVDHNGEKELYSGYITCNLQIETPLFIPDPEKTKYRTVKPIGPTDLPDDWVWEGDSMEVSFRQDEHDRVKILGKWQKGSIVPSTPERISLDELKNMKQKVIEGRGTLFRGINGRTTYLETYIPLRESHKVMEFFRFRDEPAIPPTSLKGMIRSIAEALSNSCFSQFDTKRLYHRQVGYGSRATPAIVLSKSERAYLFNWSKVPGEDSKLVLKFLKEHFSIAWIEDAKIRKVDDKQIIIISSNDTWAEISIDENGDKANLKIDGGIVCDLHLEKENDELKIYRKKDGKIGLLDDENKRCHAWIPAYPQKNNSIDISRYKTGDPIFVRIVQQRHPRRNWRYFKVIDVKNDIKQLQGPSSQKYQGILKITGHNVKRKHDERVFFSETYQSNLGDCYQKFCSDRSNWEAYLGKLEQRNFNSNHQKDYNELIEEQKKRRKSSHEQGDSDIVETIRQHDKLAVGDLVYAYFDDNKKLIGLFPVLVPLFWDRNSPYDLLCNLSDGDLERCKNPDSLFCPCCRIFGMVSGDEEGKALAGKVSFTIASWANDKEPSWDTKTLQMLNTPHSTCEQFYLVDEPDNERVVRYDDRFEEHAKVGRLRGRKFYFHHRQIKDEYAYTKASDRMNSTVELLKEGVFKFTADFHNLTDYELGLLLYSLELEGAESDLRHKLGMGKPLGLGSVKITIDKLVRIDREERYRAILSDGIGKDKEGESLGMDKQLYRDKCILKGFKKVQAGEQTDNEDAIEQAFNNLPYIQDLKVMLAFKDFHELEIKYPSARSKGDGKPYGYEWFQQNKKKPLPTTHEVKVNSNSKVLDGWSNKGGSRDE